LQERAGVPAGPLVVAAVVSGVAAGVGWAPPPAGALAIATASAALAVAIDDARVRRVLVIFALAAAAVVYGASARTRALAPALGVWLDERAPTGRAVEPVVVRGRLAADAAETPAGVRVLIDVDAVGEAGHWRRAPGRVQAHVAGSLAGPRVADWRGGRAVVAPVALRRPQWLQNPGASSPAWQAMRQRFDLVGSIKSAALVEVSAGPWWTEWPAAARAHVRSAVTRYVAPHHGQTAAVTTAILIGDRAALDDDLERRLQAAGTYHTIAISGGNVAIMTALCYLLCRLVLRSATIAAIVAIAVIVSYGAVVGAQPAVGRAVLAACVYLALWIRGLVPRAVHALATVALVFVVFDPLAVLDVGAWLSFGATLGILLGVRRALQHVAAWRAGAGGSSWWPATARQVARAGLGLLAATIAAELALLPVSASIFSRVGVAGLALNFVAIPAMTAAQLAGLALVVCADWWPAAARVFALLAHTSAGALLESSRLVTLVPWVSWRVAPVGIGWTIVFYVALLAALRAGGRRVWRRTLWGVALASGLVIVTAPDLERAQPRPGRLRVTTIDVGQGDAILVQFPAGRSLLVDAGGSSGAFDIGSRVITPALWALGVRRLDWLAVSHPDLDHIGGALGTARDLEPREIWEGVPVPPSRERTRLRDALLAAGVAWRSLSAGQSIDVGPVRVDVLHPPPPEWERQRTRNEDSLVLGLTFGDVEIWLTGDAGLEFEERLIAKASRAPLRVLKVAHHGSRSSTSETLLASFRPDAALVSAGRANLFGHPAPDVLARLDRHRARVFRTDRDGAIVLETDGRGVDVRTMSGRRWILRQ
jgi:competence protein ComEC